MKTIERTITVSHTFPAGSISHIHQIDVKTNGAVTAGTLEVYGVTTFANYWMGSIDLTPADPDPLMFEILADGIYVELDSYDGDSVDVAHLMVG